MLETFVITMCLSSSSLYVCEQVGAAYYSQAGIEEYFKPYYRDEYKYIVAVAYTIQNKELYVPISKNFIYKGNGLVFIKDF